MTLTTQETAAMAAALKAEEDRHAFTVTKWMRERKELVDALAAERAEVRRLLEREKAASTQADALGYARGREEADAYKTAWAEAMGELRFCYDLLTDVREGFDVAAGRCAWSQEEMKAWADAIDSVIFPNPALTAEPAKPCCLCPDKHYPECQRYKP